MQNKVRELCTLAWYPDLSDLITGIIFTNQNAIIKAIFMQKENTNEDKKNQSKPEETTQSNTVQDEKVTEAFLW